MTVLVYWPHALAARGDVAEEEGLPTGGVHGTTNCLHLGVSLHTSQQVVHARLIFQRGRYTHIELVLILAFHLNDERWVVLPLVVVQFPTASFSGAQFLVSLATSCVLVGPWMGRLLFTGSSHLQQLGQFIHWQSLLVSPSMRALSMTSVARDVIAGGGWLNEEGKDEHYCDQ